MVFGYFMYVNVLSQQTLTFGNKWVKKKSSQVGAKVGYCQIFRSGIWQ